ncbi:hypothetical protein [Streptomyces sp. NBC_01174]|uniref:hypothetical protein n=1 Tax=Streptomyces sp. NBC_01174 TaxID=2903758 RepID=UPI00387043A0
MPGTPHLLRATGSASGLNTTRIAERTGDFYALEAVYGLFVAVAASGALLLAFRRRSAMPLRVPPALAWGGSAATACWGGWLSLSAC